MHFLMALFLFVALVVSSFRCSSFHVQFYFDCNNFLQQHFHLAKSLLLCVLYSYNPVLVSLRPVPLFFFFCSVFRDKKLRSPCRFEVWILLLHFYAKTLSQKKAKEELPLFLPYSSYLFQLLAEMGNDTFKRDYDL